LILTGTIELGNVSNSGYADIHVACRYGNKHVLKILLSRGIPVNHPDRYGSTPLHYAAKYGHLEICRFLVEANGSPAARNSQGQSPYDMSDNHLIRQYLLPLQLACEREMNPNAGSAMVPPPPAGAGFLPSSTTMMNSFFPPANGSTSGIPVYSSSSSNQYPPQAYTPHQYPSAPPPAAPPQQPVHTYPSVPIQSQDNSQAPPSPPVGRPNVFVNKTATLPIATSPALPESSSSPPILQHTTSGSDFQEMTQNPPTPPVQWNHSTVSSAPSSSGSQTSRRIIQPGLSLSFLLPSSSSFLSVTSDGFESSASKLALKEKYGHTKTVTTVAPPPIFGAPPGPAAAPPPMMGAGPPPAAYPPPAYLQNRYVAYDPNTPPVPYGQPNVSSAYPSMAPPVISTDSSSYPPSVYSPPQQSFTPSPSHVRTLDPTPPPHPTSTTRLNTSPRIHVNPVDNVFNPVTDRVVSATSSSSALM
jgi:hypothetical protein